MPALAVPGMPRSARAGKGRGLVLRDIKERRRETVTLTPELAAFLRPQRAEQAPDSPTDAAETSWTFAGEARRHCAPLVSLARAV